MFPCCLFSLTVALIDVWAAPHGESNSYKVSVDMSMLGAHSACITIVRGLTRSFAIVFQGIMGIIYISDFMKGKPALRWPVSVCLENSHCIERNVESYYKFLNFYVCSCRFDLLHYTWYCFLAFIRNKRYSKAKFSYAINLAFC